MSILYLTFGVCLICGAAILICNHGAYEWKHSEQKGHEEFWRFKYFMSKLDISKESQRYIINDIKSIDELVAANNRLQKALKEM